jgi:hypothetical protein
MLITFAKIIGVANLAYTHAPPANSQVRICTDTAYSKLLKAQFAGIPFIIKLCNKSSLIIELPPIIMRLTRQLF